MEITHNNIPEALNTILKRIQNIEGQLQQVLPKPEDKLLTQKELARYLNMSLTTIIRYQKRGMPHVYRGVKPMYSKLAVEEYLNNIKK